MGKVDSFCYVTRCVVKAPYGEYNHFIDAFIHAAFCWYLQTSHAMKKALFVEQVCAGKYLYDKNDDEKRLHF